ncbi:MAG: PAS domain-containing protein [Halobacteriaceae archaeon]
MVPNERGTGDAQAGPPAVLVVGAEPSFVDRVAERLSAREAEPTARVERVENPGDVLDRLGVADGDGEPARPPADAAGVETVSDHAPSVVVGFHHPGRIDALGLHERLDDAVRPSFLFLDPTADPDLANRALAAGVDEYVPVGSRGPGAGHPDGDSGRERDLAGVVATRCRRLLENGSAAAAGSADGSLPLRSLLADLSVMVYRCRNERGWPMQYVSDGARGLTGHPPSALIEGEVSYGADVIHPEDRESVWETVQAAVADGEPFRTDYRIRRADGEVRWVWEQGRVVDPDADELFLEGFITDVTERRRVREALAERNERLEEFASIVSHDLRNPLNVATGRVELARRSGDEAHLEDAAAALDRMAELVDDLLALARQGREVESPEPVDLAAVASEAWAAVETHGADLAVESERRLLADQSRLAQLFENLFANAVQHGGRDVTVRVGLLPDDEGFYVADDGRGIAEEDRESVFDAGYTTAEEGTGFGLRIVEDVAAGHGWSVALAESESGGARFEVRGVTWA